MWLSSSKKAPEARDYKSDQLAAELSLALHDFILLRTGDIRYKGIQGGTKRYKGIKGDTKRYKGLQGDTRGPYLELVIAGTGQTPCWSPVTGWSWGMSGSISVQRWG